MKKFKTSYIVIAALLLIAGGYWWYRSSKVTISQVRYVTAEAAKGNLTVAISGSCNVSVDQLATVDPTINGTVSGLVVKVGDTVKRGQLLFVIENDQLGVEVARATASLEQSRNSVESAKVNKKSADADYDAAKKKDDKDGGAYTLKQLNVLKEKTRIAKEGIVYAEKSFTASQAAYMETLSEANKRRVTAPISGTVNEINVKNGDDLGKVASGSTRQFPVIIGDLGTLKAVVEVNEVDIPNVSVGQKVALTFDALEDLNATGRVEKINALGTVSQGIVTYGVTIGIDTLDTRIKPQMSVSASIITDVKQNVVTVPNSAIKSERNTTYVEVLKDKQPERREVEIGVANATDTEIISGVQIGESVVTQTIDRSAAATAASSNQGGGFRIPGLGGGGNNRGGNNR